jgi:hypothetical protein
MPESLHTKSADVVLESAKQTGIDIVHDGSIIF